MIRYVHLFATKHPLCRTFSSTTAFMMLSASDIAPPVHRIKEGANFLDKEVYRKSLPVLAARIPAEKTNNFVTALRQSLLDLQRTRHVVPDTEDEEKRLVLLKFQEQDELPAEAVDFIEKEGGTVVGHNVELKYDYWTADDILQATLPEELVADAPSGFTTMGHLAHLNLNKEYLPYKHIIGQVILDKNPRIKTVVNKLDSIHTQFRFFDMELIAGEPNFVVQHSESSCRFTFDFREVYWNSRLHAEHDRLVQLFHPGDGVIADAMAGVGPFVVPAAKKGCAVLANDLNPNSVKWLRKNVVDNNASGLLRVYCEDARAFIRSSFRRASTEPFPPYIGKSPSKRKQHKEERESRRDKIKGNSRSIDTELPKRRRIAHFVMNLPETAIQFLDAFRGVLVHESAELRALYEITPMVHCYCFTRFLDPREAGEDIRKRAEVALGGSLEEDVDLHYVRSVAPNKDMYCISFRLPREIALQN